MQAFNNTSIESWPLTLHWLRDHRSHHLTDAQALHIQRLNRPISGQARVCQGCGWPASIADLCMLCCDMTEAIMPQEGLMQAHEEWRQERVRRRQGLL